MSGKSRRSTRNDAKKQKTKHHNEERNTKENKFPLIKPKSEIDVKEDSSGFEEEEIRILPISSRYALLPPIDCDDSDSKTSLSYEIILERSRSNLEKQKSIALPPIESSDGVPTKINAFLQKNYDRIRQEQAEILEPSKKTKTHTVHKEIKRGDSWELIKAEKIRCNEMKSHEAKLKREKLLQQQKTTKRHNKERRNRNRRKKLGNTYADRIDETTSEECF